MLQIAQRGAIALLDQARQLWADSDLRFSHNRWLQKLGAAQPGCAEAIRMAFGTEFNQPAFQLMLVLVVGAILTRWRRTVTNNGVDDGGNSRLATLRLTTVSSVVLRGIAGCSEGHCLRC